MQNTDGKQKSLAKTYKLTKIIAWLLVFGGGVIFAIGIGQQVLTSTTYGILLAIGSLPLFVLSKIAKKRIDELGR